jgi:hypothetical protein
VIVSLMLLAGTALAQPQTQPNGGGQPGAGIVNGNGAQPQPQLDAGYQPSIYPEQFYYEYPPGYPAVEVRAVPPALARRAVATAEFWRAQGTLHLLVLEMKKAFERSRDYVQAVAEEREAFAQLEEARRDALRSVMEDPNYRAHSELRQNIADQIEQRREDRHVTYDEILAMAQVKMGYSAQVTALEAAALSADPDVQQARERLRRAHARLSELRAQFDLEVRADRDVLVARRNVADARIVKLGAEVYADAVLDAREIALRYAYYGTPNEIYKYKYLNYGYYGYGYPYYGHQMGYPIGWSGYRY